MFDKTRKFILERVSDVGRFGRVARPLMQTSVLGVSCWVAKGYWVNRVNSLYLTGDVCKIVIAVVQAVYGDV